MINPYYHFVFGCLCTIVILNMNYGQKKTCSRGSKKNQLCKVGDKLDVCSSLPVDSCCFAKWGEGCYK